MEADSFIGFILFLVFFYIFFIIPVILVYKILEKIITKKEIVLENKTENDSENKEREIYPYIKQKSLFYPSENRFYFILKDIIGEKYLIFSKVRMCDLLYIPSMYRSDYFSYFGKIKSKHIDFVICDKENVEPILAIELDGSSHFRFDRVERDDFVNNIFADANFPLLRFSVSVNYSKDEIFKQLSFYLTKLNLDI